MKSHMVKHQNVGKVKCSICGKVFKRKLYLVVSQSSSVSEHAYTTVLSANNVDLMDFFRNTCDYTPVRSPMNATYVASKSEWNPISSNISKFTSGGKLRNLPRKWVISLDPAKVTTFYSNPGGLLILFDLKSSNVSHDTASVWISLNKFFCTSTASTCPD